ncbi:MAG: hypothetical protein ACREFI_12810 [Stellaceae bacterium]
METLALKLVLTPALIGISTMVGRRWGQAVGGWLVGLPLTSGPVVLFLALEHGTAFGANAAEGSLRGLVAESSFALCYAWTAQRQDWPLAFLAGALGFAVAGFAMQLIAPAPVLLVGMVIAALVLTLRLLPRFTGSAAAVRPQWWDLPARMVTATLLVLALTSAAAWLGPQLSGLISTFPLLAGVLTVFAHHAQGKGAAINVLRGLLLGLFSFAAFFVALGATLDRVGIASTFAAALTAALGVQTVSLLFARRTMRRP